MFTGRLAGSPARLWPASGIPRSFLGALSLSGRNGRGSLRISVRQSPVSPPFTLRLRGLRRRKGPPVLAAVTRSPGEMVIADVSDPGPARAGNVIVRPEAVGICGSDFHLFSGDVGALSGARDFYPRIQGHEVSAIVEDPGDTATVNRGQPGRHMAAAALRQLLPCRAGRPNVCPRFRLVGVHIDGGLQQRLEVPATAVFGVGDLEPDSDGLRRARLDRGARPGPRQAAAGRAGRRVRRRADRPGRTARRGGRGGAG